MRCRDKKRYTNILTRVLHPARADQLRETHFSTCTVQGLACALCKEADQHAESSVLRFPANTLLVLPHTCPSPSHRFRPIPETSFSSQSHDNEHADTRDMQKGHGKHISQKADYAWIPSKHTHKFVFISSQPLQGPSVLPLSIISWCPWFQATLYG